MITINNYLQNKCANDVEKTILSDLTHSKKKISSTFFYDEKGSKLFEKITTLPEYYLTRTEIPLIEQAANYLKESLKDVHIIEFGSGDPTKISIFFENIPDELRETISYVPFDVSNAVIQESCDILLQRFPGLSIHGIVADFMTQLDVIPQKTKKIICFLGSTIGNFTNRQATDFLKKLHDIMNSEDQLLIGFDLIKNKNIIEKAYNDSQKVTEQFNKNILNVVNNIIGTDFAPDQFEHVAFYNTDFSRIEMHLKATKQMTISSPKLSSPIQIDKGEMIHTENSHKFTFEQIKKIAERADLAIEKFFCDGKNWFTLVIFTKP